MENYIRKISTEFITQAFRLDSRIKLTRFTQNTYCTEIHLGLDDCDFYKNFEFRHDQDGKIQELVLVHQFIKDFDLDFLVGKLAEFIADQDRVKERGY